MEESLKARLTAPLDEATVRAMNPLTLAYIGDSICTHYIRRYLVAGGHRKVMELTKLTTAYVKAGGQRRLLSAVEDQLTEAEAAIVRRGRNTKSHVPKNADLTDYRLATGYEALLGYLHLLGEEERLVELIAAGLAAWETTEA